MLLPTTPKTPRRSRRARRHGRALVLVEVIYSHVDFLLELAFDRAIDISRFDGSQFTITDGVHNHQQYSGETPPDVLDPTRISITLDAVGAYAPTDLKLSATAMTGIKAVDDGGTWAGVTDLNLPFP